MLWGAWVCPLLTYFCVMDNAFWLAEKLEQFKSTTCCKSCMWIVWSFSISRGILNCQRFLGIRMTHASLSNNICFFSTHSFFHIDCKWNYILIQFLHPKTKKNKLFPSLSQNNLKVFAQDETIFVFILFFYAVRVSFWPMGILMWDILIGVNLILFNCPLPFDLLA